MDAREVVMPSKQLRSIRLYPQFSSEAWVLGLSHLYGVEQEATEAASGAVDRTEWTRDQFFPRERTPQSAVL